MMAATLFSQAIVLLMAPRLGSREIALVYGVMLGSASGLQTSVRGVMWPMYYDLQHLGAISGVASMLLIVAYALGPMPMGVARDLMGTYSTALTIATVLPLALLIGALTLQRPHRAQLAKPVTG